MHDHNGSGGTVIYTDPKENNDFDNIGNTGMGGGGSVRGSSGGGGIKRKKFVTPTLPSATSQADYINSMYAANEAAARENLRASYEQEMAARDYAAGKLPGTYDAAANQAATQAAINRANFNEQAAASGLNTGAGSQARLSQNNAMLGNVASIRKAQADAQADLDFQRVQMEQQYQAAIRQALAQNDMQKAQALYDEARRVDESIVNTAINQANLDFQAWTHYYR